MMFPNPPSLQYLWRRKVVVPGQDLWQHLFSRRTRILGVVRWEELRVPRKLYLHHVTELRGWNHQCHRWRHMEHHNQEVCNFIMFYLHVAIVDLRYRTPKVLFINEYKQFTYELCFPRDLATCVTDAGCEARSVTIMFQSYTIVIDNSEYITVSTESVQTGTVN